MAYKSKKKKKTKLVKFQVLFKYLVDVETFFKNTTLLKEVLFSIS